MKFKTFALIMSFILSCVLIILSGCEEQQAKRSERLDPEWFNQPMWQQVRSGSTQNVSASNPDRNVVTRNQAPKIKFNSLSHDFGKIGIGTKNNICEFVFTNVGNDDLIISELVVSCDCTMAFLEDDIRQYAPGESGRILADYTDNEAGQAIKHIYLGTNDPENPQIQLAIAAELVAPVYYEPKRLNLSLIEANGDCPDIIIKSLDNKPFSITGFQSNADCIKVDFNPNEKGTQFVLKPKVNVETLGLLLEGKFNINISHPDCKVVSGTFYAPPRFSINPQRLILNNVDPSRTIIKTINVISNYGEEFNLNATFTNSRVINVRETLKTTKGYQVTVEITPPATKGEAKMFSENINLSLPGIDTFTVQCNGYYPGTPVPNLTEEGPCKTCGPVRLDKPSLSKNPR